MAYCFEKSFTISGQLVLRSQKLSYGSRMSQFFFYLSFVLHIAVQQFIKNTYRIKHKQGNKELEEKKGVLAGIFYCQEKQPIPRVLIYCKTTVKKKKLYVW